MKKKALSVVLSAAMFCGTFAGNICPVMAEEKSDVKIQVVVPGNYQEFPEGMDENNNFIVDYWREKTGYDFEIVILPTGDETNEKLNLMFNGGQVEGIVFINAPYLARQYAEQGLLAPLDDYLADCSVYNSYPDIQVMGHYEDSQYGIITPTDGIFAQGALTIARKDVMEANGITEQPKTFEEFNDLLYMFKEQGMTGIGVYGSPTSKTFDPLLAMFGIASTYASNFTLNDEGNLEFSMISDRAKDYLAYAQQLYKDGIIPQDFASLDTASVNELYLGGKLGIAVNDYAWQTPGIFDSSEELGYDSKYIDYPTDYYGNPAYGDTFTDVCTMAVMVAKDCPYKDEAMDFLNFLVQPETLMMDNYGIEGEHYEMKDGIPVVTDKASEIAWAVYYRLVFPPEDWYTVYGVGADWAEYYYPGERHTIGKEIYDLQLPVSGSLINKRKDLVTTIVDPYFTSVITGEKNLDETWDAYVAEWLAAGGQEITDEYNRLFEETGKEVFIAKSYLPEDHPEYTGKYLFNGAE